MLYVIVDVCNELWTYMVRTFKVECVSQFLLEKFWYTWVVEFELKPIDFK